MVFLWTELPYSLQLEFLQPERASFAQDLMTKEIHLSKHISTRSWSKTSTPAAHVRLNSSFYHCGIWKCQASRGRTATKSTWGGGREVHRTFSMTWQCQRVVCKTEPLNKYFLWLVTTTKLFCVKWTKRWWQRHVVRQSVTDNPQTVFLLQFWWKQCPLESLTYTSHFLLRNVFRNSEKLECLVALSRALLIMGTCHIWSWGWPWLPIAKARGLRIEH